MIKSSLQVILKQIPVDMMSTADRQSILNEIKVLSMLNHPNVIEYYENFLQDKAMVGGFHAVLQAICIIKVIAMEFAAGGTLYDLVDSKAKSGLLLEEEEVKIKIKMSLITIQFFFPRLRICSPK